MNPSENYPSEHWEEQLKSVARRSYIKEALEESKNIDIAKTHVREKEMTRKLTDVIESLTKGETLEPRIENLCARMLTEIQEQYPDIRGIVIMGSSAHGGGLVRSLVGLDEQDLDWGVITSNTDLDNAIPTGIMHLGESIIRRTYSSVGLSKPLESCTLFNPENFIEPALEEDLVETMLLIAPETLVFYFEPTLPRELGEQNVALIKEKLKKMEKTDVDLYTITTDKMLSAWHDMHELKLKHFRGYAEDARTQNKITQIVRNSKILMDTKFRKSLDIETH